MGSNALNNQTALSWECFVDNGSITPLRLYWSFENNVAFCDQSGLSDAPHLVTVNVQAANGTFWLDYIRYLPTANTPGLENAAISIDSTNPDLNFQSWTPSEIFPQGFETSATGNKLSFNFIGKKDFMQWYYVHPSNIFHTGRSLLWYGFFTPSLPFDTSTKTAIYSIDGQPPVPFDVFPGITVPGFDTSNAQYNTLLFDTGSLPTGPHILDVTYLGTSNNTPLSFHYLIVQNGTSDSATVSSSVASLSPTSSSNWGIQTYSLLPASGSLAMSTGISTNQSSLASMLALAGLTAYYLLSGRY